MSADYQPPRVGSSLRSMAFERRVHQCLAAMIRESQQLTEKHGAVVVEEARERFLKLKAQRKGMR